MPEAEPELRLKAPLVLVAAGAEAAALPELAAAAEPLEAPEDAGLQERNGIINCITKNCGWLTLPRLHS